MTTENGAASVLSENWATLWEAFADAQPEHTAVVVGEQALTWRQLDDRAARLAGALTERGVGTGTRIAQLLYNCPEYLESAYAAFKLRATPVNVSYRYKPAEIAYICDNAGAEVAFPAGCVAALRNATRSSRKISRRPATFTALSRLFLISS